jgi:hypothetical protein
MEEFTLSNIESIISKTIEEDKAIEEKNIDNLSYSNRAAKKLPYLQVAKELLEDGHKVVNHQQGIMVNDKFILGASLRSWRCEGRNKWYSYSKKSFAKILKQEIKECNK